MNGSHDRRIHADALHKQLRGSSAARFKRQAIAMLASVALGGVTLPCWMLDHQAIVATGTYYWARTKLWAVSPWADDTAVDIHVGDQILEGRSARAVVALPYSQQSARQVWAYATWGSGLGFVEPRPDHASYIASWVKVLQNDHRAIVQAAAHAERAVAYLHQLASPYKMREAA